MPNHHDDLRERVERLEEHQERMEQELDGEPGELGMAHKVSILWKLTVGVACAAAGAGGVWFTKFVQGIMKP